MEDEIVENVINHNTWEKWWTRTCNGREKTFFPRKKLEKHLMQYHVPNMKKVIFLRKIIKKHEQNVVKSGLIIIPASRGRSKWIGKDILRNSMRQYMCWIIVIYKHRRFHVLWFHQTMIQTLYLQVDRSRSESERSSYKTPWGSTCAES